MPLETEPAVYVCTAEPLTNRNPKLEFAVVGTELENAGNTVTLALLRMLALTF